MFVGHTAQLGGAELGLLELAQLYGHNCRVLLFADGPLRVRLEEAGVQAEVAEAGTQLLAVRNTSSWSSVCAMPSALAMGARVRHATKGMDVVVATSQKAFLVCALAKTCKSPPLVWQLHDLFNTNNFSVINRLAAVTLANHRADCVMVNSQATGVAFVSVGGRFDLVETVYCGIRAPNKEVAQTPDAQVRSILNLGDSPLIGSFSRIAPWKGQDVLLRALYDLPKVHALIVGDALFGEKEYKIHLEEMSKAPELKGRVHWLGFRDDVLSLMSQCDIVVHASTEPEPFGRVILEGLLSGSPIIATRAGGVAELIEDGVTGYLVPPNDHTALVRTIREILSDPVASRAMAQRGAAYAHERFSVEAWRSNFEHVIINVARK